MNANWICYILYRNCLVIEGKMEGIRRGRRRKQLLREREDTGIWNRNHYIALSVERAFWRRVWTRCETDYRMNEL